MFWVFFFFLLEALWENHLSTVSCKGAVLKDACDYTGFAQLIQDNLPISRSTALITSAKSTLPCKITYLQVPGIRTPAPGGPLFYRR